MDEHRHHERRKAPLAQRLGKRVRKFERHVVEEIELTDTATARASVKRERFVALRFASAWFGLWALLTIAGLLARDAWPVDETRLLGTAWEMWARGKYLVPYLNGEAELHAPMFFWLIHLGWFMGGVSEWWARLLPALGALASLLLVQRLARRLWPGETEVARYAPLLLLGSLAFSLSTGLMAPDSWLLCFLLLAYQGLFIQWRARDHRAWLLTAAGLACALLTGGPIALIYFLPLALLAPAWARSPRPTWRHWYADVFKATGLAVAIGASWLFLAGAREGWGYVVRYLSQAGLGTPLELFARHQPWWWYAWVAPLALLPWSVLPLAWMRLWHIRREPLDEGITCCLAWFVLTLALLSLLPMKQPQFLLPLVPAGVLLATRMLLAGELRDVYQEKGFAGMAIPLIITGGALMVLPRLPRVEHLPGMLWEQSPLVGMAVMAVGIATAWLPIKDVPRRVFDIGALSVLLVLLASLGIGAQFNSLYPLPTIAGVVAQAQAAGREVAYVGDYHGEFQFAGRLRVPLAVVDPANADAWVERNADALVVAPVGSWQSRAAPNAKPVLEVPYQDGLLRIFDARQLSPPPAANN